MHNLIGAAGVEIDAIEAGYMQGPKPWTFRVSGVRRRIDLPTSVIVPSSPARYAFSVYSRWLREHGPLARDVPAEDIRASCSRPLIGGKLMRLTDKVAIVTGGA